MSRLPPPPRRPLQPNEGENNTFRQTPESAALLDQHLTEYANDVRAEADE